ISQQPTKERIDVIGKHLRFSIGAYKFCGGFLKLRINLPYLLLFLLRDMNLSSLSSRALRFSHFLGLHAWPPRSSARNFFDSPTAAGPRIRTLRYPLAFYALYVLLV